MRLPLITRSGRLPWLSGELPVDLRKWVQRHAHVVDRILTRTWDADSCTGNALLWGWLLSRAGHRGYLVTDGIFAGGDNMEWVGHDWVVLEAGTTILDGAWRQFRMPRKSIHPDLYVGGNRHGLSYFNLDDAKRFSGNTKMVDAMRQCEARWTRSA